MNAANAASQPAKNANGSFSLLDLTSVHAKCNAFSCTEIVLMSRIKRLLILPSFIVLQFTFHFFF